MNRVVWSGVGEKRDRAYAQLLMSGVSGLRLHPSCGPKALRQDDLHGGLETAVLCCFCFCKGSASIWGYFLLTNVIFTPVLWKAGIIIPIL